MAWRSMGIDFDPWKIHGNQFEIDFGSVFMDFWWRSENGFKARKTVSRLNLDESTPVSFLKFGLKGSHASFENTIWKNMER